MTPIVIDCSVAMAWFYQEKGSALADAAQDRLRDQGALVPVIWPLEVLNVLLVGERRKRQTHAGSLRFIERLSVLPITVDTQTPVRVWETVFSIARDQGLSSYDAAYAELALRRGATLATLDRSLRNAARKLGLAVFAP